MVDITNLGARLNYKPGTNLPICILVHGWSGDYTSFEDTMFTRLADYGLFVASVGLRGRNSADGANDASGREAYDIYDLLTTIRTNYPVVASSTLAAIVGYSGGGGSAFAAACKFPDAWNVIVSYFGISDYGRDGTDGWYANNNGDYTAAIVTAVGDTPANVPDNYYARDATVAIKNFTGGYIYQYRDKQDAIVPWAHGNRIKSAMDAAGLTNYSANFSDIGDAIRYTHGYPASYPDLIIPEPIWVAKIKSQAAWTIPAAGTITVIGYIKTKRFTIWLNTGLDAAATVVYDTVAGTYTVTPLTSNAVVAVTITQGALTASGNTDGETLFTVA